MEPPAVRAAGRPVAVLIRCPHEHGDDGLAALDGAREGGVIGEAEVAVEPDERGTGHQERRSEQKREMYV